MKTEVDCILVDGRSIGQGSTCASTSLLQYELGHAVAFAHKTGWGGQCNQYPTSYAVNQSIS
ncbi:MAG: hypothetical protein WDM78_19270 [Puia sp.]